MDGLSGHGSMQQRGRAALQAPRRTSRKINLASAAGGIGPWCHPEEAESHAKRATPAEEPALSLPKGPMQLEAPLTLIVTLTLILTGKGTPSAAPKKQSFERARLQAAP
jgi:hypothetical protein